LTKKLKAGIRCTVRIDVKAYERPGRIPGTVVSPITPRLENGIYWGYHTRFAKSLMTIFDKCPYGSYDLKIGTSERGTTTCDDPTFTTLPKFKHCVIVFGGIAGIEECVNADESLRLTGQECSRLFDIWINTCPYQGSGTIRTEESLFISLSSLRPYIVAQSYQSFSNNEAINNIIFSDNELSDESD